MKKLSDTITLGISTTNNVRALVMALFSVMNSRAVPQRIKVRLEGDFPGFADFYLEQSAEFARIAGIELSIHVFESTGVRAARQWHLDNCTSRFLWMIDDDVIVEPDCLKMLCAGVCDEKTFAHQGVKTDLNNRRGYKDFFKGVHPRSELGPDASPNHRWDQLPEGMPLRNLPTYEIGTIDTGNVLIDVELASDGGITFQPFADSVNCGGEDTLFALQGLQKGLNVRFNPWAVSYHLEKPEARFNEFSARCEMVLRAMSELGMDDDLKERMKKNLMTWEFQDSKNKKQDKQNETQSNTKNGQESQSSSEDEKVFPEKSGPQKVRRSIFEEACIRESRVQSEIRGEKVEVEVEGNREARPEESTEGLAANQQDADKDGGKASQES